MDALIQTLPRFFFFFSNQLFFFVKEEGRVRGQDMYLFKLDQQIWADL